MSAGEAQVFVTVFGVVLLTSLGGVIWARRIALARPTRHPTQAFSSDHVATAAAIITGLLLIAAIGLLAVLIGRQSGLD